MARTQKRKRITASVRKMSLHSISIYIRGFGLPVLESLKHGKPCICSSQGAIGENSTKGGCLILENTTPKQIADAIERLLKDAALFRRLRKEARKLNFRTWSDYAKDILDFHSELNLMNEEST